MVQLEPLLLHSTMSPVPTDSVSGSFLNGACISIATRLNVLRLTSLKTKSYFSESLEATKLICPLVVETVNNAALHGAGMKEFSFVTSALPDV